MCSFPLFMLAVQKYEISGAFALHNSENLLHGSLQFRVPSVRSMASSHLNQYRTKPVPQIAFIEQFNPVY